MSDVNWCVSTRPARFSIMTDNPPPSPVVLFAYMRPAHLEQTITSLLRNPEAGATHLHVFCDAAKRPEHQKQVDAVRRYVSSITGFASVTAVHRQANMGLANSIIGGVSDLLRLHESVIVLEDDLVVSPHFLRYMNDGLACYANDSKVASIHGYTYPVAQSLPETFFLRGADCWGWATWRRAWEHFNPNGGELLAELRASKLTHAFDLDGAYPYTRMLKDQIAGRNNSWAVRWHASCFLKDMLTLYPGRSLVANIGNDDSGTHGGYSTDYDVEVALQPVSVRRIELIESRTATNAVSTYFKTKRRVFRRILNRARRTLVRVTKRRTATIPMARKGLLKTFAETVFQWEASLAAAWASSAHHRLMAAQWWLKPQPEHFDHHIDLSYQWLKTRNPMWVERGVFSQLALKGGALLELSCGDGFNARNFYSHKSNHVVACDFDPAAIATANRKNRADNLQYVVADIRDNIPAGSFENVVWDFAFPIVRYFKPDEIKRILEQIKARLTSDGILSGYTMAENRDSGTPQGEYEFRHIKDLHDFLSPYYKNVIVFETRYPDRHNFYFWASDGVIPFQSDWPHAYGHRGSA